MGNHWTLQDAKNKFSAVVEAAQNGEPQHVTKRGVDAVVVLSATEYERLSKLGEKPKKTFVEHLMDFPKIPEEFEDIFDKREPMKLEPRDIDFD
ncbi:MAG: type II toxin-antitoxin system Phd/YefM family antitoxin [Methylobacterium mesophilicum]|nr:type II toxin-antitoxin system Phd/YefM family antitoxin [Methylobacterium mesophilicum]